MGNELIVSQFFSFILDNLENLLLKRILKYIKIPYVEKYLLMNIIEHVLLCLGLHIKYIVIILIIL